MSERLEDRNFDDAEVVIVGRALQHYFVTTDHGQDQLDTYMLYYSISSNETVDTLLLKLSTTFRNLIYYSLVSLSVLGSSEVSSSEVGCSDSVDNSQHQLLVALMEKFKPNFERK